MAAMEARRCKRTARERVAYVRGEMRARGEGATTTKVSSADVEAATAMEAATAVKATAAAAATTSGVCRDRQDHRASQHGSARGEFRPEFEHGYRHGTPSHQ